MVRLINGKNIDTVAGIAYRILRTQEIFTHIEELNNPDLTPCIYAMWHANQFLVHGIKHRNKVNILISNSIDGEIVARTCEKWGFKVIRGSSNKKGAVASTFQMIEQLKEGNYVAIMVDGPSGPLHKVKNGAIKIAQMSGAPIVPSYWYSPQKTFVSLLSWDKMKTPLGFCNILNLYGEPVYVKPDATDEELIQIKEQIKSSLEKLEEEAPAKYEEALKNQLWKKKK